MVRHMNLFKVTKESFPALVLAYAVDKGEISLSEAKRRFRKKKGKKKKKK